MKIKLCPNRGNSGWVVPLFMVVIVVILLGLFISLVARCAKLPVRNPGGDGDTNEALAASFTWDSPLPLHSQSVSNEPESSERTSNTFQASVCFLWEDIMTNGVLVILRSLDWQEWTMLYNVMFGEQTFTNVVMVNAGQTSTNRMTSIEFLDTDAPEEQAFYRGLIITNTP